MPEYNEYCSSVACFKQMVSATNFTPQLKNLLKNFPKFRKKLFEGLIEQVQAELEDSARNLKALTSFAALSSEEMLNQNQVLIEIITSIDKSRKLLVDNSNANVRAIGWELRKIIIHFPTSFSLSADTHAFIEKTQQSILAEEAAKVRAAETSLDRGRDRRNSAEPSSPRATPSFFKKKESINAVSTEQMPALPSREIFSSQLQTFPIKGQWRLKLAETDHNGQYTIQSIDDKGVIHGNRDVKVIAGKVSAVLELSERNNDYIEHLAAVMVHAAIKSGISLDTIHVHCVNKKMNAALHAEIKRCTPVVQPVINEDLTNPVAPQHFQV